MSKQEREPAQIIYRKTPQGGTVEIRGTSGEILRGLVRLCMSIFKHCGVDITKFCDQLPTLILMEKASLDGSVLIDLEAMRKAQEGGDGAE